jgi:hypothetical protein
MTLDMFSRALRTFCGTLGTLCGTLLPFCGRTLRTFSRLTANRAFTAALCILCALCCKPLRTLFRTLCRCRQTMARTLRAFCLFAAPLRFLCMRNRAGLLRTAALLTAFRTASALRIGTAASARCLFCCRSRLFVIG